MTWVRNSSIPLEHVPLTERERRWARCPLCGGPLPTVAFGGGSVRGLYCTVDHAERASQRDDLRVVQPYLPYQHRLAGSAAAGRRQQD